MKLSLGSLSFRTVVAFWVSGILYVTLLLAGVFFVNIYSEDKVSSAYELELANNAQLASFIEKIILSAPLLTLEQMKNSSQIVFSKNAPCSTGTVSAAASIAAGQSAVSTAVVVSSVFEKSLHASQFSIDAVLASPAFISACEHYKTSPLKTLFIPNDQHYIFPYFIAVVPGTPEKLMMVSLDGIGGSSSTGLQTLISPRDGLLWQSTQDPIDPNVSKEMKSLAARTIESHIPGLKENSDGTFFSYSPVLDEMVLFSVGSRDSISNAVHQLVSQFLLLLLGSSFLIILFARQVVERLSVPLTRLRDAAIALGHGDFSSRIEISGDHEFEVVQKTFNHMAEELTRLIEVARESSKLESELELAEKVQQILFPPSLFTVGDHELRSQLKNATRCGGDWWGCIEVNTRAGETKLVLLIGDVTGHGAPAALVTAAAQGGLSVVSQWVKENPHLVDDPRKILSLFNQAVHRSSGGTLTMSFLITVLDEKAQTITVSNAGHNWPYLLTKDESGAYTIKAVGAASPVLGSNYEQVFDHMESHAWRPGDKLFLYTDGLIDCFKEDKNLFDKRAMLHVLRENLPNNAETILRELMKTRAIKTENMPAADDVTVVICTNGAVSP